MSPREISLPLKTTISSRIRTICAITAVKPIRSRTARTVPEAWLMPAIAVRKSCLGTTESLVVASPRYNSTTRVRTFSKFMLPSPRSLASLR